MFVEKLRSAYNEAVDKEKNEAINAFFKGQAKVICKSALEEAFVAAKAGKKTASISFVAHPSVITHVMNMLSGEGVASIVVREFKDAHGNLAVTLGLSGWVDTTRGSKEGVP